MIFARPTGSSSGYLLPRATVKLSCGSNPEEKLENSKILQMMTAWVEQAEKYRSGEITKDQYDEWRYNFPKDDATGHWAKVASKEFSDAMVEKFKDKLKDM